MLHRGCVTLLTLLLSFPVLASPVELKPYRAVYSNKVDATISISGEAIRELKQLEDGTWELSVEASAMMANIRETTRVTQRDNQLLPLRYDYHRRILTRNRTAQLRFDWDAGYVTTDIDDKPWRMSIEPGVHDKLSYQLQMPADIAAGKTTLSYQVADGGRMQTYRFNVMGEDLVDTPAGQFNAIRVERDRGENSDRETLIWFAPELDYMIVRLEQIEPKGDRFTLLLKQAQ
ncbi:hypothetical protein LH51_05235 [Nitrincola sp. A-D6]|uniref:DUF3108 domain-containing protein n=1 Tax=Nitrincola sp. A-D6 TaxID=1545442 RepID=UPI00051FC095|nr:DUF3108 domain-containing protein [Nitrincola sp. A-D6]KGK42698.1 hypothetical protein LH51_05235 [Nitrincola sp. A-D6]